MPGWDLKRYEPSAGPPATWPRPGGWTTDQWLARWAFEHRQAAIRETWRRRLLRESRVRFRMFAGRQIAAVREDTQQMQGLKMDSEREWMESAPARYRESAPARRVA